MILNTHFDKTKIISPIIKPGTGVSINSIDEELYEDGGAPASGKDVEQHWWGISIKLDDKNANGFYTAAIEDTGFAALIATYSPDPSISKLLAIVLGSTSALLAESLSGYQTNGSGTGITISIIIIPTIPVPLPIITNNPLA